MTAATAPAPSMFAVFHKRDFSPLWVAQLVPPDRNLCQRT